jgi:cytochrome b561
MNQKYSISMRIVHWAMALIIITLLAVGFYMTNFLSSQADNRATIYALHKSFGVVVMFLIVARIFFRISSSIPPLPNSMPKTIQKLASSAHYLLYFLMIFMPLSGYLMSNSFGYPVHLFGIKMPMLVEKNMELGSFFSNVHKFLGYAFVAVLSLHILGAIKHRFFDLAQNDVLKRMTFTK